MHAAELLASTAQHRTLQQQAREHSSAVERCGPTLPSPLPCHGPLTHRTLKLEESEEERRRQEEALQTLLAKARKAATEAEARFEAERTVRIATCHAHSRSPTDTCHF